MPISFRHPKFEPFLRASEVLEGLRRRKEKKNTSPPFFGKNKIEGTPWLKNATNDITHWLIVCDDFVKFLN